MQLLWLSMLKMPPELLRLCACHLLTWFSIIAEAVFFTDFMGQVIYNGDPTVRESGRCIDIFLHSPCKKKSFNNMFACRIGTVFLFDPVSDCHILISLFSLSLSGSFQLYLVGKLSQRSSNGMLGPGYICHDCCYMLRYCTSALARTPSHTFSLQTLD